MNKKYFLYAIVSVVILGSTGAIAYASNVSGENMFSELAGKISQKFNLNQNDVQMIIDEYHSEMRIKQGQNFEERRAEMDARASEMLKQAVADGKLTQTQVDLIIAKRTELESQRVDLKTGDKDKISENMKSQMDSLKQWAEDNNINMQYLMFGGMGMKGGFGMQKGDKSTCDGSCIDKN